jgi:hypothetical protein
MRSTIGIPKTLSLLPPSVGITIGIIRESVPSAYSTGKKRNGQGDGIRTHTVRVTDASKLEQKNNSASCQEENRSDEETECRSGLSQIRHKWECRGFFVLKFGDFYE